MSAKQNNQSFVSWEEAAGLRGMFRSFFPLCGLILLRPADFFRQIHSRAASRLSRRIGKALVFAVILGYIRLLLDVTNIFWFQSLAHTPLFAHARPQISFPSDMTGSPFLLLRPLVAFAVTLVLVSAGVKMVLGFDKPLAPALLIVAYKSVSELFYCIPVVGGLFAVSWSLALLTIGVRELYRASLPRSFLTAFVMPLIILLFIVLAAGTVLTRALVIFYPEAQPQMQKINDVTAYVTTASIVDAAVSYKKELGFYPPHLGAVRKYLSDIDVVSHSGGYVYDYRRPDDHHFVLEARPLKQGETGHFIFYADESGEVRLGGSDGRRIENIRELEEMVLTGHDKASRR